MYDDFGDGKYDYLGIAKRVPLHADKAEEFLGHGDTFNALQHARTCLSLAAAGFQHTRAWHRALTVVNRLSSR